MRKPVSRALAGAASALFAVAAAPGAALAHHGSLEDIGVGIAAGAVAVALVAVALAFGVRSLRRRRVRHRGAGL